MSDAASLSYSGARATRVAPADDGSLGTMIDNAFSLLRRRWPLLLAGIVLGLGGGYFKTINTPPSYVASTSVLIEDQGNQMASEDANMAKAVSPKLSNEVQSLRSPALMERVVAELQLQADPEFNPYLGSVSAKAAPASGAASGASGPQAPDNRQLEATKARLARALSVESVTGSTVIMIKMRASDPVKAATIVDAVAQGYLAEQLDSKLSTTRQASVWLQQQVDQVGADLKRQSAALQAEKASSGLNIGGGSSIADQQVSALSAQLSQARADVAARQARGSRDGLGMGGADAVGEVLGSGAVQALRARENEAQRMISELSVRYGPEHPRMQVAREQLNDVRRQMQEEMGRVSRGSSNELQVAQRRVAAIEGELARWTGTLARDTRRASVMQQLQSQVTATEATYQGYVQRLQQITDLEKLQRPDGRIIVRAQVPGRPDSPKPPQDLAQGLLAGLALAAGIIVLLESLQRGLRTPQAVEDWTGIACLVSVPQLNRRELNDLKAKGGQGPADYVALKPLSVYSETLRQLRTDLILAPEGDKIPQVILFSSAVAGEGKSTTALAFARTLAMSGAKTILIEGDIRRPTIAAVAGIDAKIALIDVINNPAILTDALSRDRLSDLDILPTVSLGERQGVDSALERFSTLLDHLRPTYQFIVVDTAPILAVAETQTMARQADAVIVVVKWGTTTGDAVRVAIHELQSARITPRGIALNSVDYKAQSKYTKGDAASYYNSYKKYYAG
jgi:polysaccharide biosynthesis transport protein